MPRISQLPSLTAADNADELAIVDVSSSTTKKVTKADLLKGQALTNLNGGTTPGVLTTDASGNVTVAVSTVDANGWSVTKLSSKISIYQKPLGSVNASTVAVSMPNNQFPVGETWDTCGPYTKIYARTISGTSGLANDIRAIARGAGGLSTFDALVTAGANTTAYITAEIIKVG